MKRTILSIMILIGMTTMVHAQSVNKIDTFMYSPSLDTLKMVDVILPPGYDDHLNMCYPVIYVLHDWAENQDVNYLNTYMTSWVFQELIDPCILVIPSSYCEPFGGSWYTNSVIWGNYRDYIAVDLITWVDSSFRTVPEKSHRGIFGVGMGSIGALYLAMDHPENYSAISAWAACGMFKDSAEYYGAKVALEAGGTPPYTYSYNGISKPWTGMSLSFSGGLTPNLSSAQTYVTPSIVDFPFDEFGNTIDSTWQKICDQVPLYGSSLLDASDSISYLLSCGEYDEWLQYPVMLAFYDSLISRGISAEFLSYVGGHSLSATVKYRTLEFMDSILGTPRDPCHAAATSIPIRVPSLNVYPNPFSEFATIEMENLQADEISIEFLSLEGVTIWGIAQSVTPYQTNRITVDTKSLDPGIYILHVLIGNHHSYLKVVKN